MARVARNPVVEKKGRIPPQNLDAEESLLGGVLIDPEALNKVVDVVDAEDFYREDHRVIYELVLDLYERSEPIDLITVSSLARDKGLIEKIGGITHLSRLVDGMPTSANIVQYAKMVKEKALLRNLMHIATEIVEKGYEVDTNVDNFIDEAEKMIFQISEKKFRPSFYSIKDLVMENVKTVERLCEKKQAITGIPSGFAELDKMTSGLQPSDLIIVAGRPSMGKTAFCLNIAQNAALSEGGRSIGIFSLEMSKEQLVMRLLSSEAEVEFSKLRSGMVKDAEWHQLGTAAGRLYTAPIYIDDSPALSVLELRARARRLKKEHGLDLLVIDYLQLMRGRTTGPDRREQEISEISRFLKALAKELDIPVIAISQLNRMVEQREDKRPRLSDLRESGAIEQDADVILFIYRDEVYNKNSERKGVAEVIIGKQRNGPTGEVEVAFLAPYTAFRNLYTTE
ncbi:MAG: Replicative DNA helicase [Syntrophorhabdaceae bacterium PtaU1.Bin034]|nr:MAG: Replicative DNA helicase [Syntrophorhabdaceae bacterium PtaU1.Bin034]